MTYYLDDTIAAIATAPGGAARGMVRLSGPRVVDCLADCFVPRANLSLDQIGQPTVVEGNAEIELAGGKRALPCDLYLWATNRSYTRQPVAELHTLGSPPLVDALLASVCRAGARLAEPGEFTLRAFLAGRLDLTQAEAVLGVIDAQGDAELNAALAQLAGGLAEPLSRLRDDLLQLLAELEAGLDFVEEAIEFIDKDELSRRLTAAIAETCQIDEQLAGRGDAVALEQVVLVGAPNAGKSSLFNALVARWGRESAPPALVSRERGTTRDYLMAQLDLDGLRCQLIDTAGIADGPGDVVDEQRLPAAAAQAMTQVKRRQAQLRLWCTDAAVDDGELPSDSVDIVVITKADLPHPANFNGLRQSKPVLITSSVTGEGLDQLADALREALVRTAGIDGGHAVATTAARCRESLRLTEDALNQANDIAASGGGEELVAAEVRLALNELGKVIGAVYTDDVLDRIFSSFCIGK